MKPLKKKIIRITGITLLLVIFLGCGRAGVDNIDNLQMIAEDYLNKKYNKKFEIYSMEKVDIGQNFAKYIYEGTAGVQEENGNVFEYTITDAKTIKDNYPMTLFEESILHDVEKILEDERIKIRNLYLEYLQKMETFLDYEDYKGNQNIVVHCDIELVIENEEGVRDVYRILEELKEEGYYFFVSIKFAETKKYVIYDDDIPMISQDEFIKRFLK